MSRYFFLLFFFQNNIILFRKNNIYIYRFVLILTSLAGLDERFSMITIVFIMALFFYK
jgi:hypothetical protein